ncbi:MAG: hypothetical protein ACU0CI_12625 [Shimia sp.]
MTNPDKSLKTEAQDAKAEVEKEARKAAGAAQDETNKRVEAAKAEARKFGENAKAEADRAYDKVAERAAEPVDRTADALRDAGGHYREGSYAREAAESAAGYVERLSDAIQSSDLDQIGHEVKAFANRNPVAFVAGAAALGFLAARMAKASRPYEEPEFDTTRRSAPAPQAPTPHPTPAYQPTMNSPTSGLANGKVS